MLEELEIHVVFSKEKNILAIGYCNEKSDVYGSLSKTMPVDMADDEVLSLVGKFIDLKKYKPNIVRDVSIDLN